MPYLPLPVMYFSTQLRQYLEASWRWRRLRFDAPIIFGNARAKSGSHLLLQVLHGIWRALPYACVRQTPVRMITKKGHQRNQQEIVRELRRIRPGVIGWGYLSPTEENIRVLCTPGRVNYFIYRDPRDQLISHILYAVDMHEGHRLRQYYLGLPDMNARITATIQGINVPGYEYPNVRALYDGVFKWLEQPGVMAIRFEDLRHNPRPVIENMLLLIKENGLEFPTSLAALVDIVVSAIQPSKSPTFRQGKSGGWREYFTDEHKRLFKEIAGDVLIKLGYEKDYDW